MLRRLFLLALLLLLPFGTAQRCLDELRAGLPNEALSETASGRDAVRMLKRAVDLLEPTLPPLTNSTLPSALTPNDPVFDEALFLSERGLLPDAWQPDTIAPAVWRTMLERVARWYGVASVVDVEDETLSVGNLIADLSRLIAAVTPGLEPLALIATAPDDRNTITFWAIIRNTSVYPRMIVISPSDVAISLNGDPERALPYLATCAVPLENYVTAPADVARQLFLANNDRTEMVVAYSEPPALYNYRVPADEAIAFLEFRTSLLDDIDRYAALFLGEGPGPLTVTRLIPRVRTNMGPGEIMGLFR